MCNSRISFSKDMRIQPLLLDVREVFATDGVLKLGKTISDIGTKLSPLLKRTKMLCSVSIQFEFFIHPFWEVWHS